MPELEIPHEEIADDPAGKKIGILAAILAVFLAVVTILSHRAHTDAVVMKTEANDQWAFYQAKNIRSTVLGTTSELLTLMAPKSEATSAALAKYQSDRKRYEGENKEIQATAMERDKESKVAEAKALRFDLGEGLLEIGLVLTSMYFISRKKMFPVIGVAAGIGGTVVAALGLLIH